MKREFIAIGLLDDGSDDGKDVTLSDQYTVARCVSFIEGYLHRGGAGEYIGFAIKHVDSEDGEYIYMDANTWNKPEFKTTKNKIMIEG
jgi:hypothetical protein